MGSQVSMAVTPTEAALSEYNHGFVSYQTRNLGGCNTNGVALTYLHGFKFAPTTPLFFQTGLKMDFGFYHIGSDIELDEIVVKEDANMKTLTFSVPVDLAYRISCGEKAIFTPYVGLSAKLHTMAKTTLDGANPWDNDLEINYFDYGMKHFQMGWHAGLGVQVDRFYFNTEFGTDFTPITEGGSYTPTFSLGVGYTF